ncbi:iron-containing redox enzyme family protein [Streptomyces monomycini]|uniref:iron-containing redox enzyme family protein n=1 Tax=Streptomyces monomycini TaxID=371720 RepID=UPI0004AB2CA5|nr:iron-containing redox enzyme family protein [Streptomyces monomycini]
MNPPTANAAPAPTTNAAPDSVELHGADGLQDLYWPPVHPFATLDPALVRFLAAPPPAQTTHLARLRADPEAHGRFLHDHLATLYAHSFGYRDGPAAHAPDDDLEIALYAARTRLEHEFLTYGCAPGPLPALRNQEAAADHLEALAADNPGASHPLFRFLATDATREQIEYFLRCELIRNEIVDDEVALLVVGLQGQQKAVAAANLWDECGRGRLENFHTYWLRRQLGSPAGWEALARYRRAHPWFAKPTSNLFAALLLRPARVQAAYGCFLVFESWVEPHFTLLLEGMTRVGIHDDDMRVYYTAHTRIDPRHSRELCDGLRAQRPRLTPPEVRAALYGAHLAVDTGVRQYDRIRRHLETMGPRSVRAPRPQDH